MFQPVFVFDSHRPEINPHIVAIAREKGFRMVDIREVGSTVHGGNPPVVVYNEDGFMTGRVPEGEKRFDPPKKTGIMCMFSSNKGHIHGLPNRLEFLEWFFGTKMKHWSVFTGNFRI